MNFPKITIVIPTFNEEQDLPHCLKSIFSQNYPKEKLDVIVVDDGSTDKTLEIAKKFGVRILYNGTKDAEVGKMIGFKHAKGGLFMYFDADMRFASKTALKSLTKPLIENSDVVGSLAVYCVNKKMPWVTRCLSYDPFQLDPVLKFFSTKIKEVIVERRFDYWICEYTKNKILPQSLMLYRASKLKPYVAGEKQLIDNEVPAIFVANGYKKFALAWGGKVEHLIARGLVELFKKRVRNIARTYSPNLNKRRFRWFSFKKDFFKIILWMIYTYTLFLPILVSIYKFIKYKDRAFLGYFLLNLFSTTAIIFGILRYSKLQIFKI